MLTAIKEELSVRRTCETVRGQAGASISGGLLQRDLTPPLAHGSRSPLEKMMLLAAERAEGGEGREEDKEDGDASSEAFSTPQHQQVYVASAAYRRPRTGFGASVVEEARPSVWSSKRCAPSP